MSSFTSNGTGFAGSLAFPATGIRAKCLTIAAVDIQRPCFLARCGLVRQSVRRACSWATLNATEL